MKQIRLFSIILCLLSALSVAARIEFTSGSGKKIDNINEWDFSFFIGGGILGPGGQIRKQMSFSGFDDSNYNWFSKSNVTHPKQTNWPVYDFTFRTYFSPKNGISGSFGSCNNIEISGLESIGVGNFLFLNSRLSYFSVSYLYRTPDRQRTFEIGLVLINHSIKDRSDFDTSPWDSSIHPGIDLGYTIHLYSGKLFFIDLKTNLRLAPNAGIGPLIKSNTLLEEFKSEFKATETNLSSLTAGLQLGFHFTKLKGN